MMRQREDLEKLLIRKGREKTFSFMVFMLEGKCHEGDMMNLI